jgi:hypothetical protein
MIATTCHCGAVRISIPRVPETLTHCDCSICRRYGTLWAYYAKDEVKIEAAPGTTEWSGLKLVVRKELRQ